MGKVAEYFSNFLQNKWVVLIAWQVCSLVVCLTGTMCTLIVSKNGETIPLLMLAMTYFIIFITNVWWWPRSDISWWRYLVVSVFGLVGDWTAVLAYNKTSLASAMLFATTVIFWVAPLSYFVFKRKINWKQFLAILLAAIGISLVLVADGTKGSKLVGNLIALASAICYAISTVTQEKLVNDESIRLYLCRFSSCACPLALILSGSIEWKTICHYEWNWKVIIMMFSYAILLALYYMISPVIMQHSNATVMNLSVLTSNFYSLAISIIFFHLRASWLYLVGFFCIPIAILLFVLMEEKPNKGHEYNPL